MKKFLILAAIAVGCGEISTEDVKPADYYLERYRPQFHYSPEGNWMNDPNGMVYFDGEYHLFYQYYPDSTVWGPMHWGHTVSDDLVTWQHLPIALSPDSLGYIFSGSAVIDWRNTSGLREGDSPPMVAIFTYHNPNGAKTDFQYQGIAFSNDRGRTWSKYAGNPVLEKLGSIDFRDPKVSWHEPTEKWIMTLAVDDHIEFYRSENLLDWQYLSSFGENEGSHEGVWECPDLFPLTVEEIGKQVWVLVVSIGPGGERGSATQYFVGDFDGQEFKSAHYPERVIWLDQGRDNYAGVTWSDPPDNLTKIFMGWMSNWDYAQVVPTEKWRSGMTVPRKLTAFQTVNGVRVRSYPVEELKKLRQDTLDVNRVLVNVSTDWSHLLKDGPLLDMELIITKIKDFGSWEISLSNDSEELSFGFDDKTDEVYVDRNNAGKSDFSEKFAGRHSAMRLSQDPQMAIRVLIDVSSIEFFADMGEVVITEMFFPENAYNTMTFSTPDGAVVTEGKVYHLKSIWNGAFDLKPKGQALTN